MRFIDSLVNTANNHKNATKLSGMWALGQDRPPGIIDISCMYMHWKAFHVVCH